MAKYKQIHLNLSEQVQEQLEALKEDMGVPTIGEAIRRSISIARTLEKEQRDGAEVILRNPRTKQEKVLVRA